MDTPIYAELAEKLGVDVPEQWRPSPRPRPEQTGDVREDDET